MTDKTDYSFITDLIDGGELDDMLDLLIETAVARRKYLREMQGARNRVVFIPGTHVRVINIKPKYLTGITGIVSTQRARRPGDLMVDIDPRHHHRLGRYGTQLSIPASSLELN